MPTVLLHAKTVPTLGCPPGRQKIDYHDSGCKGLVLEVRSSGGKTWYLRYRDVQGQQRQLRLGDAQDVPLSLAREKGAYLRGVRAKGGDPRAPEAGLRACPTFDAFMKERYLPYVMNYKRSWRTDETLFRVQLSPTFGKARLSQITAEQVVAFHGGLMAKGYAKASCNRCLVLLRYAFNLALKWGVEGVTQNPTHTVPLFDERESRRERFLTQEEAQRLQAALTNSSATWLEPIVWMLLLTGARKGEVLRARWDEMDIEGRSWRITHTKSGRARHVPLSEGMLVLLGGLTPVPNSPYLFTNPTTGKPYNTVFRGWDRVRKAAGLAEVRLHDLRHSFASFLVNAGRSLYEVQTLLGHSHSRTTMRYAHLARDTLREACECVSGIVGGAKGPDSAEKGA